MTMEKPHGVRVPAPIFNRRRPKQALFAHPNNDNAGGFGPPRHDHNQGMGSIQPGARGNFKASYQSSQRSTTPATSQQNPRPTATSSNQYSRPGTPANVRPPNVRQTEPNRASTPGQGVGYRYMSGPSIQQQNAYNSSCIHARDSSSAATSPQNEYSPSFGNVNNNSLFHPSNNHHKSGGSECDNYHGGQGNFYNSSGQNVDKGNEIYGGRPHNTATARSLNKSTSFGGGSANFSGDPGNAHGGPRIIGGGQPRYGDCPATRGNGPKNSTSEQDYTPQFGQQPWGDQSLPTASLGQNNAWTPTSTPLKDTANSLTVPEAQSSAKAMDNSLRFITASIQGMKHWDKFTCKISMLFEIFGMLNSAVSTSVNHDRIEFVLKDDKDSLKCVFFQIDRQIPRLVRTQWHRCVGRYNQQTKVFRCVSLRPAEQAEMKWNKKQIAASDRTMRELVTS